ncbi:MAG: MBG domain-containing protein, partial [Anaeroplasmataceae bacterium]|nr:MBG domain-containing protein [Anaeroplasmataceae bacterium]
YIIYALSLIFVLLLVGCKSEEFSISASITSVNTTETEVSFYATVESTDAVVARAIIEKDGSLIQEINPIEVNKTSSYSFKDLLSNTEYTISIQYKFESDSFIRIAREDVKTKGVSVSDITITCSDLETVYDGKVKSLTATTSVEGISLVYKYSLNGNKVDEPIHPGEYDVDISFAGNESYNPCSVRKKLIIKKADVSIVCEDAEVVYDGTTKNVVATCSVPNASLSYDYYLGEEQVLLPTNVGSYRVVIAYAGNEDYNACSIEKSLVIKPQPIKMDLHDIEIDYEEEYDVATDLLVSYVVAYYQGETLLTEKPTLPGEYKAVISITDPNYVGTTTINLKIKKLDYDIEYMDSYSFLLGDPIEFLVDDFVKVEKFLDDNPIDEFNKVGEYVIKFSIVDHLIYNDMEFSIKVIIDTKKHIIVYNEAIYVENTENYVLYCDTNYDVVLSDIYYLDGIVIPRPTTPGKYQIKLIYEEDSEYVAFEKTLDFILYPSETTISEVEDGIIYTRGTVIAQDETYSYLVDEGAVLFVEDLRLEVGKSYLIIGSLEYVGGTPLVTILKKEEVTTINQTPLQATLIDYEEHRDDYANHFISLRGLVIENNNRSYLVIEDGFALPLTKSYASYIDQSIPLEIQIISFGESYLLISDGVGTLTRKEELYVGAYLYSFPEVSTALPKSIESTDIQIEYLESSNTKVINPITLKVSQQQKDVVVEVKVLLNLDEYSLEKTYSVLVLKQKEEELMIYSIEMHQQYGDSVLITYGDYEILIDAGDTKDGPYVNQFLKEHISSDNHLDMIIVTHCHSDHMGGLAYSSNESSKNVKALDGIASIGTIIDYGHDRVGNALHNSWVNIRKKYIAGGAEYYPVYN